MMAGRNVRKYLFQFAHEHLEFKLPEMKSIASLSGVKLTIPEDYSINFPFLVLDLPSEEIPRNIVKRTILFPFLVLDLPSEEIARNIMKRTILVKSLFELWADGTSYKELYSNLHTLPKSFTQNYTDENQTFRIIVESFNKQLSHAEKVAKIERFLDNGLNFGKIKLNSPENSFQLLEYYEEPKCNVPVEEPRKVFFGRWLADGQRNNLKVYDLRTRKYIGNTSMDAGLALVMANQAGVQKGHFVFDPFVGTGSLLVGAAHYGAYVMGTDIDFKLLHGKGRASRAGQKWRFKDENIRSNLRQYGLEDCYIDALIGDSSKSEMFRITSLFDAIITDPPYGVREPTKKVGTNQRSASPTQKPPSEATSQQSCESTMTHYHISEVYKDLLNFAARYLKHGGKLVYWLPVFRAEYKEACIPKHKCLNVTYNSEQPFNTKISRRLITMEKVLETQDEAILNSATLEYDPFENETFREKYFLNPEDLYANKDEKTLVKQNIPRKIKKKLKKKLKEELANMEMARSSTKTKECSNSYDTKLTLDIGEDAPISNKRKLESSGKDTISEIQLQCAFSDAIDDIVNSEHCDNENLENK